MTPTEIVDEYPDFFMKRDNDSLLHLPSNHAYYAQVQVLILLYSVMIHNN